MSVEVRSVGLGAGLAGHAWRRTTAWLPKLLCLLSVAGALLEVAASLAAPFSRSAPAWSLSSGIPYVDYSVRLDPLSAYFTLALSLLAVSALAYSFGYIPHSPARRSPGLFGFFLNLLLLSLTLVFTAANVLFFLIAWELMAVSAYFLVVFHHESAQSRKGGLLYFLMSRAVLE